MATARRTRPDAGVDNGHDHAEPEMRHGAHQRQRSRPDVERCHAVGEIDDRNPRCMVRHRGPHHSGEFVSEPVVGQ